MLPEAGGRPEDPGRGPVELKAPEAYRVAADPRLVQLPEKAPGPEVGVGQQLPAVEDGPGRHPGALEPVHQVQVVVLPGPLGDNGVKLVLIPAAGNYVGKPGVGGEVGPAHQPAEGGKLGVVFDGDA